MALAIIALMSALAIGVHAQSIINQANTQSILGNSSIGYMYPVGNYTVHVAMPMYIAVILNSTGSPIAYTELSMNGTITTYSENEISNASPNQSYLLYVYLLNGSSMRIGYSWMLGKEVNKIIQNRSWASQVRLIPISEYPRGNITIMVRLPTGVPADNGYVYISLPLLAQPMYGPPLVPAINATVSPSAPIASLPWMPMLSAPVTNGTAVFINVPLIPYIATYYKSINIINMIGLRSTINETSRNETINIYGYKVNISIITITYKEANPSFIVIRGQGLVAPGRNAIINTTLEELPAPIIPRLYAASPTTAVSAMSNQYQVVANQSKSIKVIHVVPPQQYVSPLAMAVIIAIIVVATLIGAAAAIIVRSKVQSL